METLGYSCSILAHLTAGEVLKSEEIFAMMTEYLSRGEGKDLPDKVSAVFQFDIRATKGGPVAAHGKSTWRTAHRSARKALPRALTPCSQWSTKTSRKSVWELWTHRWHLCKARWRLRETSERQPSSLQSCSHHQLQRTLLNSRLESSKLIA